VHEAIRELKRTEEKEEIASKAKIQALNDASEAAAKKKISEREATRWRETEEEARNLVEITRAAVIVAESTRQQEEALIEKRKYEATAQSACQKKKDAELLVATEGDIQMKAESRAKFYHEQHEQMQQKVDKMRGVQLASKIRVAADKMEIELAKRIMAKDDLRIQMAKDELVNAMDEDKRMEKEAMAKTKAIREARVLKAHYMIATKAGVGESEERLHLHKVGRELEVAKNKLDQLRDQMGLPPDFKVMAAAPWRSQFGGPGGPSSLALVAIAEPSVSRASGVVALASPTNAAADAAANLDDEDNDPGAIIAVRGPGDSTRASPGGAIPAVALGVESFEDARNRIRKTLLEANSGLISSK